MAGPEPWLSLLTPHLPPSRLVASASVRGLCLTRPSAPGRESLRSTLLLAQWGWAVSSKLVKSVFLSFVLNAFFYQFLCVLFIVLVRAFCYSLFRYSSQHIWVLVLITFEF